MQDIIKHIKQLPLHVLAVLVLIEFIRPTIKIIGSFAGFEVDPMTVRVMTILVAVIWVGTVVALRIKRPVLFLAACGAVYAWLSIAVAVVIQIIAPGSGGDDVPSIPVLLSAGLIGATIYNAVQGFVLGVVASLLQRILRRRPLS